MLTILAAAVLMAPPTDGSQWTWTYEDVQSAKATGAPPGFKVETNPHLGKCLFSLAVKEAGPQGPKKLTLKVKKGSLTLAGRTWDVESSYGEAALTEQGQQGEVGGDVTLLKHAVERLLVADPLVVAAGNGACDEGSSAKVAEAAGKLVRGFIGTSETTVKSAKGQCKGKTYAVQFTLAVPAGDQTLDFPWTGTVEVAPDAWRASYTFQGASRVEVQTGKKTVRIDSKIDFKSRVDKK